MNEFETQIKIAHGPIGMLMSFGYVAATMVTIYLEKTMGFLQLNSLTLATLALLMTIDFMTGLWKSKRLKVAITSKTAKEGFYEKVIIIIAILTLSLLLKSTGIQSRAIVNVLVVIGCLIEAYSVFGNLQSIKTRSPITEQDAITYVLSIGRKKLWNWIKYLSKKGEPGSGDI